MSYQSQLFWENALGIFKPPTVHLQSNPEPFFTLAKELYPGQFKVGNLPKTTTTTTTHLTGVFCKQDIFKGEDPAPFYGKQSYLFVPVDIAEMQ